MSLSLLLPLGLAALAAFIVPLLIHLVRQPQPRTQDFPALRWLRESMRPKRRLRFDEIGLLLVRLLLLALIALLLADPVVRGLVSGPRHVIAVSTAIDAATARAALAATRAEWRWLAPGFPLLGENGRPGPSQPLASLLRELDAGLAPDDELTVLVPDIVRGLDAERIALIHPLTWQVVDQADESMPTALPTKPRAVAIRHATSGAVGLRYVQNAFAALSESEPGNWLIDDQASDVPVPEASEWLVWFDDEMPASIEAWVERGGRVLRATTPAAPATAGEVVWQDDTGTTLARARRNGKGRVIELAVALRPAELPALLDAGFPQRLKALFEEPPAAPTSAHAADLPPLHRDGKPLQQPTSLAAALGLLIALLFLAERVLATRRRAQA